jgi:hypothetical protein
MDLDLADFHLPSAIDEGRGWRCSDSSRMDNRPELIACVLVRSSACFGTLQLAESYLTRTLFRRILARIERLAWHPT